VVAGSLGGLGAAGWLFLNRSLYRDFGEKDQVAQVRVAGGAICKAAANLPRTWA